MTFLELDQLAAELLPARTVLSVVAAPASSSAAAAGGGAVGGGGATIVSTCTTTTTYHEPGLIGLLGLGINQVPVTTTTCTPSVVATY